MNTGNKVSFSYHLNFWKDLLKRDFSFINFEDNLFHNGKAFVLYFEFVLFTNFIYKINDVFFDET